MPDGRYLQLSGGTLTNSLTISANTPQLVLKDSTDDDDHSILFRNASNANLYSITGETDVLNIKTLTSRAMKFHTNNTLAMTIDTDGSIDTVQGLDVGGTLKLESVAQDTSSTSALVYAADGTQTVKYRTLGSNAFNSTTIPTNNSQLTNGANYITQTEGDARYLLETNNLSDLTNASTARTNLGIGNVENTALSTYTGQGGALDNQYITNGAGYLTAVPSEFLTQTEGDARYLQLSGGIITNNLTVSGDFTVSGTTTFINSQHLNIGDAIITLNADITSTTNPTENAGIEVKRGTGATKSFIWNESSDRWVADSALNVSGTLTADTSTASSGNIARLLGSAANIEFAHTGQTMTFSTAGTVTSTGGNDLNLISPSGRVAVDAGHSDGLYVDANVTATGNISGGVVTGSSIVKSGGTSSQFLKADGSVDSSTYLTAVPSEFLTQTEGDARYLQLSGGTIAGDLNLGNDSVDRKLKVYHSDNTYTEVRGFGLFFSRNSSYIRPTVDNTKTMYFGNSSYTWANVNFDATAVAFKNNGNNNLVITSGGDVDISNDLNIDGSFTNTNGNASWRKSGSSYTVTWIDDKTVKFVKTAGVYAATTPYGEHQNFIATFSFKTSNATHLGLVYHGQNSPSEDGYNVIIRNTNTVRVQKRQTNVGQSYLIGGGNGTAISGVDIDDGNWHRVTVQVIGQKIRIDIDGNQIINSSYSDTTFTVGGVGYISYDGTVEFNNLEVQEIPSTTFLDTLNLDGISEGASDTCLLYTSPSPRDGLLSRMPSSA